MKRTKTREHGILFDVNHMNSKVKDSVELYAKNAVLFTEEQTPFAQDLFFTALQGSQNYNLDDELSDVDTVSLMVPSFEQLVLDVNVAKKTHSINYSDGISTIKDFRAVFRTFIKGAVNVYQILYTPYVSVNEKYHKYFDYLRSMADDITSNNQRSIIYSTLGVIRSNLASITRVDERILSSNELGKRFAMSFYYREFIERFMDGESFGSAMVTQNADYLKRLKRWKVDSLLYSIDDMEKWADNFADRYSLLDGNELRLQELKEELDTLSLEIMEGKNYGN